MLFRSILFAVALIISFIYPITILAETPDEETPDLIIEEVFTKTKKNIIPSEDISSSLNISPLEIQKQPSLTPNILLNIQEDRITVSSKEIVIKGKVKFTQRVLINGASVSLDMNSRFTVTDSLKMGLNYFMFKASNTENISTNLARVVIRDRERVIPEIKVDLPLGIFEVDSAVIGIRGRVTDASVLYLNNKELYVKPSGRFYKRYPLYKGVNTLVFKGVSRTKDSAEVVRKVKR